MAYDTVDPKKRKGHPDVRWDTGITTVLFWCDGSRTLAAAIEAAGRELRRDLSGLVKEFEFMAEVGLIELKKAKG